MEDNAKQPAPDVAPAPSPAPAAPPAETLDTVPTEAPKTADALPNKSAMPMVVIIVILVVLGLAVAAYFTFVKRDTKTPATPGTITQTTQTTTTVDPDATSKSIDSTLSKTDDSKDYNSTDLNDSTLGL